MSTLQLQSLPQLLTTEVVFTPHSHVFFWPSWRNVGDIVLKFCIFAKIDPPNKQPNFKTMA